MATVDIRRNDTVKVIAGRDKGKQGRVLRTMPGSGKVLVEHVSIVKKNVRPNPQRQIKGGIAEQEAPISLSNVMLVCGACGPTRVRHQERSGKKVRVCAKCDGTLDKD
jgi:large subunit ribosomal protein L24